MEPAGIARCDGGHRTGRQPEQLVLSTQHAASWYLIVEGPGDEEGLFTLSVQCRPSLY